MLLALMQSKQATIFEPSDIMIRRHSSLVFLHLSQWLSPLIIRRLVATGLAGLVSLSAMGTSFAEIIQRCKVAFAHIWLFRNYLLTPDLILLLTVTLRLYLSVGLLASSLLWIQASTSSSDHLADLPILTGCGNVPFLTHE